jgi:diaminopimelate epimerase
MHAQGNDFVIIDNLDGASQITDHVSLAQDMCTPHFGVGADGLVILSASSDADVQMTIYNNDGSRAEMCGSALRCITAYCYSKMGTTVLLIATDSGIKEGRIITLGSHYSVSVNLGKAEVIKTDLSILGFSGSLVDVGNLHFVTYGEFAKDAHLVYGPQLEHHPAFPKPVNAHFVTLNSPERITMKIWEASCGATLACGTGASSAVAVGILEHGLCARTTVEMPGGMVEIEKGADGFWLSGEVTEVFRGEYQWKI